MEKFNIDAALQKLGIAELNAMQQESVSRYSEGKDMVLLSPTGTGKTLAYLLPVLQSLNPEDDRVQAVVMVPSRELALQIDGVVKQMKSVIRSLSCYGGRPAMEEHRTLMGVKPHIVIATPGRLVDHLEKRNIESDAIRTLVIDEFDKCLEFGFLDEMQHAIELMPMLGRRYLLSATESSKIPEFVGFTSLIFLNYQGENEEVASRISVHLVKSPVKDKLETLLCLLKVFGQQSTIVFLNYREAVERTYKFLKDNGVGCEMFHGAMDQEHREKSLYKFSNGTSNVLVSTDLSARGLDIPEIDNIVHYHLPLNEDAYIHRNGRTARWEAEGNSYIILHDEESLPEYIDDAPEFFIPKKLPEIQPSKWATIYIGKGKKDKLSKMDVLGFVCKIGGLTRDDVGRIDVKDHQCFVAVKRKILRSALEKMKGQKIKGIKTLFVEAK
ncbi:MAG: DEAD/DEAH box helicase [Bacteroidaceae bacterium]|nr:DEAD/DEAH box helicase [Bacteroidaceae bacterium]